LIEPPPLGLSSAKVLIIYLIIPKKPPVIPKIITPTADITSGVIIKYTHIWFYGKHGLQAAKFSNEKTA
jgi:hypothetical protein